MFKKSNKKAFTIVELVIVIAVIAILMGILFVGGTAINNNAKKSTMQSDLRNYEIALKSVVNDPANSYLQKGFLADTTEKGEIVKLLANYFEDKTALQADPADVTYNAAAKMSGETKAIAQAETKLSDPYGINYKLVIMDNSTTEHTDIAFLIVSYGKNKQTDPTSGCGLGIQLDADDVALVVRVVDSVIYTGTYESTATVSYWKAVYSAAPCGVADLDKEV